MLKISLIQRQVIMLLLVLIIILRLMQLLIRILVSKQLIQIQRLLVLLRQDNLANIANSFSTEKRNNFN